MIQITNPADCCGCTACASICKQDAISMKPDALGFLYPEVDLKKCVDCGMCDDVCAFNDKYDVSLNFDEPLAYGARHKNVEEVMKSRSGAVFVALSDYVLENGGVIYGAGYTDRFRVIHKRAVTKEERDEFRGSKYVQSDLNTVYGAVKQDLIEGNTVLFSGTPCQTAGLNSYVGKQLRTKLILVDLVCHGVPSPYLWRDYVNYIEREHNGKICEVDFRDKRKFGWTDHKESFKIANDIIANRWWTKIFYQHIMFRHSCGECHFCNTRRPSDITLADFWGWEKQDADINNDDKGVNLVLCNTEKGHLLFNAIRERLLVVDASRDVYMQPNMQHPSAVHSKRMLFEKDYQQKGFEYVYTHDYNLPPYWKMVITNVHIFLYRIKLFVLNRKE